MSARKSSRRWRTPSSTTVTRATVVSGLAKLPHSLDEESAAVAARTAARPYYLDVSRVPTTSVQMKVDSRLLSEIRKFDGTHDPTNLAYRCGGVGVQGALGLDQRRHVG